MTVTVDHKQLAHDQLSMFHMVCDLYNSKKLQHHYADKKESLIVFQSYASDALKLNKKLHKAKPCVATEKYFEFLAKVLIRLSCLRWYGRIETPEERLAHVQYVRGKYVYGLTDEELTKEPGE